MLKKLEAMRRQAQCRKNGQSNTSHGLFVERRGGTAAKAAGRRRLAPAPSDDDWFRLEDTEGLVNDALLDFCLPRLVAISQCAGRVHIYSALFYTQLAAGGWSKVKTWTRGLRQETPAGVFAKDFLFVPAHDAVTGHWWLALIVHPWAAGKAKAGVTNLPTFTPGHHETFVAILDSIDPVPRLSESTRMNPEDAEVAAQAMVVAGPRHSEAVKLIQEYLKKEWDDCFQGAADYDAGKIQGISIAVPQQTNETDCGVYVLEFVRRLLEQPSLLEYICEYKASPPQLSAPASNQLRSKWRRVGARLENDAQGPRRAIATPARARAPEAAGAEVGFVGDS
ncbi:SENP7 [Symbiodinium natans]|uniref:SENP7 protein n=1 Tax=Symbiodinium natans TaxID=878477 RepID=A0A812J898_9DINO|nr:SENP7 [Symbiodinium natans]